MKDGVDVELSTDECRPDWIEKIETTVNFVKLNRKPQFFAKPNRSHFLPTTHP